MFKVSQHLSHLDLIEYLHENQWFNTHLIPHWLNVTKFLGCLCLNHDLLYWPKTHGLNKFELFKHFISLFNKFNGTLQMAHGLD